MLRKMFQGGSSRKQGPRLAMRDADDEPPRDGPVRPCEWCRCQNRWISGRGSRTVRQGWMLTGDKGHDVFTQVRALSMEVIPYSCLINIDDMGSTRVDLPRDQGG